MLGYVMGWRCESIYYEEKEIDIGIRMDLLTEA